MRRVVAVAILLGLLRSVLGQPALGQTPLHQRIDEQIATRAGGPLSPPADDATFLRRATLDFAGRIPTVAETREFLADARPSQEKRAAAIDRLLAGDEYPRRMQQLFHVMLMERQGTHADWERFLRESFAQNRPWDQLVREMLYADPNREATRGAAFFLSKRLEHYGQNPIDMPGLVRDVGRLFLGVDVQCAQCHDHLFIDDYKQVDYQGLFAFVGNAVLRNDVKFPAVAETPLLEKVKFVSVFGGTEAATGPRLPGGTEIELPAFAKGEEYLVPPDKKAKTPGVLKFSPLKVLSEQLPTAGNEAFKRNIANRLWWLLMGRGLVHPLDLHHSDNPPSHPELLQLLADELAAHQFDMKWLLREIALSETYQRSSEWPGGEAMRPESYRGALERPLSAEQLLYSMLHATGEFARVTSQPAAAPAKADDESAANALVAADADSTQPPPAETITNKLPEPPPAIVDLFTKAFANPPREPEVEFAPSVKAALFVLNDATVLDWLNRRPGNLLDRLLAAPDAHVAADELYLSVLSRMPTADERQEFADYLATRGDQRETALRNLAWALLASTEFCLNH